MAERVGTPTHICPFACESAVRVREDNYRSAHRLKECRWSELGRGEENCDSHHWTRRGKHASEENATPLLGFHCFHAFTSLLSGLRCLVEFTAGCTDPFTPHPGWLYLCIFPQAHWAKCLVNGNGKVLRPYCQDIVYWTVLKNNKSSG